MLYSFILLLLRQCFGDFFEDFDERLNRFVRVGVRRSVHDLTFRYRRRILQGRRIVDDVFGRNFFFVTG